MTDAIQNFVAPTDAEIAALAAANATAPKDTGPTIAQIVESGTDEALIEKLQTFTNAKRIKAAAAKRIEKAEAAIAADEKLIQRIADVIEKLPEGTGSTGGAVVAVKVGDSIKFKRIKRGAGHEVVEGLVVGYKEGAENSPAQYRVQVGEGFDLEFVNIFPGQVTENLSAAPDTQEQLDLSDSTEEQEESDAINAILS